MNKRLAAPELGERIAASGYMVRYRTLPEYNGTGFDRQIVSEPDCGCYGWKRKRVKFAGVFLGYRTLGITWWHDTSGESEGDVRKAGDARTVAHLPVYLVAYSTRARPRYVLPRDVEVAR